MKLYAVYSEENAALKDIFVKGLKDPWGIELVYWGRAGEGEQDLDFGTQGFGRLMRRKIDFTVEMIKKEQGNMVIWSDLDIQFFGPCTTAIEKAIAAKDIVFLAEHWPQKEVNVGFIVLHCNAKTLAFYEAVSAMNFEAMPYYDQSAVNQLLRESSVDLSWDILPYQFWSKSVGGTPPRDILLHHANTTFPAIKEGRRVSSLELKLEQMARIREFVQTYPSWKWLLWGKWRYWAKGMVYQGFQRRSYFE